MLFLPFIWKCKQLPFILEHIPHAKHTFLNGVIILYLGRTTTADPQNIVRMLRHINQNNLFDDFQGDLSNIGDLLRHLERKGIDCSSAWDKLNN